MQIRRGWLRQNTTVFVSVLLGWRHVSTTVGHPQVTKIYNGEKLYSVWSLVVVHILNFQRDLFVMRFIRIELIICSSSKVVIVKVHIYIYIYIYMLYMASYKSCKSVDMCCRTAQSLACPRLAAYTVPSAYPDWPLHVPCEPVTGHVLPDVHRSTCSTALFLQNT